MCEKKGFRYPHTYLILSLVLGLHYLIAGGKGNLEVEWMLVDSLMKSSGISSCDMQIIIKKDNP